MEKKPFDEKSYWKKRPFCSITNISLENDWEFYHDKEGSEQFPILRCTCHDAVVFIPNQWDIVTNTPSGRTMMVRRGP